MKRKIIFALFILFTILSSVCFDMEASNQKIYNGIDISQWQGNINFDKSVENYKYTENQQYISIWH